MFPSQQPQPFYKSTGSSLQYGDGSGGFLNAMIGSNLTFAGGVLSATSGGSSSGVPNGFESVVAHGAGTGVMAADDAAFATAYATGNHVYIDPNPTFGYYKLSATITPAAGQMTWRPGSGLSGGYIIFYGTTTFLFDIRYNSVVVKGVYAQNATTPTAGGIFSIGHPTTTMYGARLIDCWGRGGYDNFYWSGKQLRCVMERCQSDIAVRANYHINTPAPYGDHQWVNNRSWGSTFYPNNIGLLISACDTSKIIGMSLKESPTPLWIYGDAGIVDQVQLIGLDIESTAAGASGMVRIGDGTFAVKNCNINGMECLSGAGSKVVLGSNADNFRTTNVIMNGTAYEDNGTNNTLDGGTVLGTNVTLAGTNSAAKNVNVSNGHITLSGQRAKAIGNTTTGASGIILSAGANNSIISNNDCSASTTPFTLDAAAKATGRGSGNLGLADW